MAKILECVPNISEGRRTEVIEAVVDVVRNTPGVALLDYSSDPSHNRTVITFFGSPEGAANRQRTRAPRVKPRSSSRETMFLPPSGKRPRTRALSPGRSSLSVRSMPKSSDLCVGGRPRGAPTAMVCPPPPRVRTAPRRHVLAFTGTQ